MIFVHYDAEGCRVVNPIYERWNYLPNFELWMQKVGIIAQEAVFKIIAEKHFTSYYQPMVPLMTELCRVIFLERGAQPATTKIYDRILGILHEGRKEMQKKSQKKIR